MRVKTGFLIYKLDEFCELGQGYHLYLNIACSTKVPPSIIMYLQSHYVFILT